MSVIRKIMETVVRFVPDKAADPLLDRQGLIGRPINRVDGALKVRGEASFTADLQVDGITHAVLVHSTIAKGKIATIDATAAEKAPGFIAIVTHENAPRMKAPTLLSLNLPIKGSAGSNLPILQSADVCYDGDPVAVVVAETLDQAEHAASLVRVTYEEKPASVAFDSVVAEATYPKEVLGEEPKHELGDAEGVLSRAAHKVDNVYRTPRYNHNALELHSTIASWSDDDHLTVFDSTQAVNGFKHQLAHIFGLKTEHVRVLSPFVGGGFGGKWSLWSNSPLCAAAAKVVKRPVKLVLSRESVFRLVGGRTLSEQRVALAAEPTGRFTALIHTGTTATTTHANYPEQFSLTPRHLYAAEAMSIGQKIVNLDTVANSWMRGPGESIATFALESAIDELAHAMGIDPIELRRINEPARDPTKDTEFSSRHLLEAYEMGARQFGWKNRNPKPRSQRDGNWLIGQGVATAYYPVFRFQGKVRLRMFADGTALVQAAASEMGMGTATAQIQHAAERLGLPIEKVSFEYGDSSLPDSPIAAGGSSQTTTIIAAVQVAVEKLHHELLDLAADDSPLKGAKLGELEARDGGLFRANSVGDGETYASILQRAGKDVIEVEKQSGMPLEMMKYSMASYGAQFCEVRVHQDTGEVRVSRWLGAFDCGRIINLKTATSQLRGGIIMGMGMALTEETVLDERRGRIVNRSLAEYHVPVNLDVPFIDVVCLDIPDERSPLGARGVGEIGVTGAAAAIANAIFNATGKRIRDLPITLDRLL